MSELRWNPLLGTYTMVASNRQGRPNMPKDWCPFCPDGTAKKVPAHYDVFMYENDFPSLSQTPPIPDFDSNGIFQTKESYGKCEVILYSPNHTATLSELSEAHIVKLIALWTERSKAISKDEKIKYVFVFENRGQEVGVTMPHPHGQIYGYSFVPLKLKVELDNCKAHYKKTNKNLVLELVEEELKFKKRVIFENESFVCFLPFFTDYPYGIFIAVKKQKSHFDDFTDIERNDLASALKLAVGMLDSLFDNTFPYMMCIHQAPVNTEEYKDCKEYYSFHIEFYPPLRAENTIKWYASSEMGAWAAANTRAVEDTAVELRNALEKFKNK